MEDLLVPWTHYVPLLPNVSDLPDKASWCLANLGWCASIGLAGRRAPNMPPMHAHTRTSLILWKMPSKTNARSMWVT